MREPLPSVVIDTADDAAPMRALSSERLTVAARSLVVLGPAAGA